MQHPFEQLKSEYEALLASMRVLVPLRVDSAAQRVVRDDLAFGTAVENETRVPAALVMAFDERESACNPRLALGQGDPWNQVSTHVPRGKGPFTSRVSAGVFYARYDHLDDNSAPWSWAYCCWKAEVWNGFGYRTHGVHSPYLWGGTNHQQPGKYVADGVFQTKDANGRPLMDQQLGVIPLMMRMTALQPTLKFVDAVQMAQHVTAPAPQPVPLGVGGGPHDVQWVQQSLNYAYLMPGDALRVDGSYGRRTREAVRSFQRFNKLVADGLYGPKTDEALVKAVEAKNALS